MVITSEIAKKALKVFRREQEKRTRGTYNGCYCVGCIECMKLALESAFVKKSDN